MTEQIDHPILITECVCNPSQSRSKMAELLFDTYGVPSIGRDLIQTIKSSHMYPDDQPSVLRVIITRSWFTTSLLSIILSLVVPLLQNASTLVFGHWVILACLFCSLILLLNYFSISLPTAYGVDAVFSYKYNQHHGVCNKDGLAICPGFMTTHVIPVCLHGVGFLLLE